MTQPEATVITEEGRRLTGIEHFPRGLDLSQGHARRIGQGRRSRDQRAFGPELGQRERDRIALLP